MNILLQEWDSKSILESKMHCGNWIMIDKNTESPRKFYSFEITDGTRISNVAFLANDHGITPTAIFFNNTKYFVVKYDNNVSFIEYSNLQIIKFYKSYSVGYELMALTRNNTLLYIHEIGVVCFDSNCQKIWEHSFNKIIRYWRESGEDELVIKYEDGYENILNLITGILSCQNPTTRSILKQ